MVCIDKVFFQKIGRKAATLNEPLVYNEQLNVNTYGIVCNRTQKRDMKTIGLQKNVDPYNNWIFRGSMMIIKVGLHREKN